MTGREDHTKGAKGRFSGRIMVGQYKLDSLLERCSAAELYAAMDQSNGEEAGVMVLTGALAEDLAALESLAQELPPLLPLNHPNLTPPHPRHLLSSSSGNRHLPLLIDHDLEGRPLAHRIASIGPMEPGEAALVAVQVLNALGALHEAGSYHGALDPMNVWLRPEHQDHDDYVCVHFPVVALRQLTNLVKRLEMGETLTPGEPARLAYAAPESLLGETPTLEADIYSVGALLHLCLAGHAPLHETTAAAEPADLIDAYLFHRPPLLSRENPALPEALCRLVSKTMAKEPDERPGLEEALEVLGQYAPEPTVTGCRTEDAKERSNTGKRKLQVEPEEPKIPVSLSLGDAVRQATAKRAAIRAVPPEEPPPAPLPVPEPPLPSSLSALASAEALPQKSPAKEEREVERGEDEADVQDEAFDTIIMKAPPREAEMARQVVLPTQKPARNEQIVPTALTPPKEEDFRTLCLTLDELKSEQANATPEDPADDDAPFKTIALTLEDLKRMEAEEE